MYVYFWYTFPYVLVARQELKTQMQENVSKFLMQKVWPVIRNLEERISADHSKHLFMRVNIRIHLRSCIIILIWFIGYIESLLLFLEKFNWIQSRLVKCSQISNFVSLAMVNIRCRDCISNFKTSTFVAFLVS